MATMYDVPADDLIEALADDLEERLDEPDWGKFVKSGVDRELPPQQENFWARRAASLLRKVADRGPIGVERLSTEYGGTKNGSNRYQVAPDKRADGSKNLIRTLLRQLEEEDLVETAGNVLEELDRPDLERYA